MARPRIIKNQQIVDAAREVFLEQGFAATTAEIARRAGVSEGTLFKRFTTKEELFAETMGLSECYDWHQDLLALAGTSEVRLNLEQAAQTFVDTARCLIPQLMVIWSRGHAPPMSKGHDPIAIDIQVLSQYLQAEMALGRMRQVDSEVIAEALIGTLIHYVHRELSVKPNVTHTDFVSRLLDSWWLGLEPLDNTAAAEEAPSKSETSFVSSDAIKDAGN